MSQSKTDSSLKNLNTAHYVDDPLAIVNAIRAGEVDAFVVCEPDGERVYTLGTGEPPYQRMIEGMKEGAAILTPDGDILYCNSHLATLLGNTAKELTMVPLSRWIGPENLQQFHGFLNKGNLDPQNVELRLVSSDGEATPVMITGSTIQVDGANVICMTVSDLSMHYRSESERAARNEAERANRLKDEYLATVSHELRNPLNVIVSWAATLRSQMRNPEVVMQGLDAIERNARAQVRIIDDILDMNRIKANSLRLELEAVDLAEVARTALESVRNLANDKKIRVGVEIEPVVVRGDPHRLNQVVFNILSNAIKFTPEEGTVNISVKQVNGKGCLRIVDSGEGIQPEFLPHVFERFRQADGSSTRRFGGLGLGLAIVKQLVELHNGEVSAESDGAGKGASFLVTLPLAVQPNDASPKITAIPNPSESETDICGISVMVVDDDPDSCEAVRRLLAAHRASVAVASSAEEALQKMEHGFPDVLIGDIAMPHVDGYELIRRVRIMERDRNRRISAIALTAFARTEDRDQAFQSGYDRHLSKPVELLNLIAVIRTLHSEKSQ